MELRLEGLEQRVGANVHLHPLDLNLVPQAVTVLLGATQAGKTTLMRLMAGLDKPYKGRVKVNGADVTGMSVRERNVAMVYQQFINYPSMTVFDNIASPLKLRKEKNLSARVNELAAKLHIEPFLKRLPAELSGGQQQRVALARALAKNAPLMLLDEPLVNLDYKLREELRDELSQLFSSGQSSVVYATTEPTEALLLGGYTAVLDKGELLQYGPTAEVFHRPQSVRVARAFSDPPMNLMQGQAQGNSVVLPGGVSLVMNLPKTTSSNATANSATSNVTIDVTRDITITIGIRAGTLRVHQRDGDLALPGQVELAEIAGSDTFVHVHTAIGELVAQLTGVHVFSLSEAITLYLNPAHVYAFGADGQLLVAPSLPASNSKAGN